MTAWSTNYPDADITVMMRLEDEEEPIWPGYWDGEAWCRSDGFDSTLKVLGWMHLEDAAKKLDAAIRTESQDISVRDYPKTDTAAASFPKEDAAKALDEVK